MASIFSSLSIESLIVPQPFPVSETISRNPLVRAKAPSNLVVTSISSNSGPALSQEKDTDKSFEREEGSNCKDNTGIRLIPKSISTTKIVLTEKADNFTFQVFSGTTTPFYLSASPHTRATTPDYSRK